MLAEREGFEPSMDGAAHTGFSRPDSCDLKGTDLRDVLIHPVAVGKRVGKSRCLICTHRWRTLAF